MKNTMNAVKEVNPKITVTINANEDTIPGNRRIELEEAIEMALALVYECKDYASSSDYPDDWKALAAALENAKGI